MCAASCERATWAWHKGHVSICSPAGAGAAGGGEGGATCCGGAAGATGAAGAGAAFFEGLAGAAGAGAAGAGAGAAAAGGAGACATGAVCGPSVGVHGMPVHWGQVQGGNSGCLSPMRYLPFSSARTRPWYAPGLVSTLCTISTSSCEPTAVAQVWARLLLLNGTPALASIFLNRRNQ